MPIRALDAIYTIVMKSHQILSIINDSIKLLTSNNQSLVIDKTMSMVQWDTINLRYLLSGLASSL